MHILSNRILIRNRETMTMRVTLEVLGVFLALASSATAQSAKECSRDPSVVGYESIAALNNDMEAELNRIRDGGAPEESYTFRLCPNQLFDAEASALLPVLNNAMFVCGNDGSRANNCIIIGGSEQVRIENSQVETYPLESLTFIGLTFADFKSNEAITGTSIAALASAPTTATFMDVTFTDFNSDFVVRQTTGFSPDPPMAVDIEDSIVVSGTSGVVFDNDGGQLIVQNVQISSVSTAAVVATANTGTSFLQDSTISASDIDSITFTTAMGTQTVMNVEVNAMNSLGDVFYAEGNGSTLSVTGSTLSQNKILPPPAWNGVVAQSGASATVMDTTIRDNSGVEFGVSATLGSTVSIKDSMITGNTGVVSLNTTTTPVFAISDSMITVETTELNNNGQFSAAAIALLRSTLTFIRSCFQDSFSEFVIFVDSSSNYNADMNFIEGYQSDRCPLDARLFKESEGSGCFLGGRVCEGTCEVVADQDACLAGAISTESPTTGANMTAVPSMDGNLTIAPSLGANVTASPTESGNITTFAPTLSPAPSILITGIPSMTPSGVPTANPTTATPTETPSMTLEPTRSPAPSAAPTISLPPTTSPAPTIMASETPSSVPTTEPTNGPPVEGGRPTPCPKESEKSKKRSSKSSKKHGNSSSSSSKSSKASSSKASSSSKSGKGKRKRGMRKRKPAKSNGKGQSGKGGKYDRSAATTTIVPAPPSEGGVRDLFRSWQSLLQQPADEDHQER